MARKKKRRSFMGKINPKWNTTIKPCVDPDCDILTNKRFLSPTGVRLVAYNYIHAEKAYEHEAPAALATAAD